MKEEKLYKIIIRTDGNDPYVYLRYMDHEPTLEDCEYILLQESYINPEDVPDDWMDDEEKQEIYDYFYSEVDLLAVATKSALLKKNMKA